MISNSHKTCFVIMPFGEEEYGTNKTVNFDNIYINLIKDTIEQIGLLPVRCDEIQISGPIHRDMVEHIAYDKVAIVDLTLLNENVFYELGIRHALKNKITVLIQAEDSNIPFNINGQRIIKYNLNNKDFSRTKELIQNFILNGLESNKFDSPVLEILNKGISNQNNNVLKKLQSIPFKLKKYNNRKIVLITGDLISRPEKIDIWVNSENTNMQMSRYYDQSLSASIRYYGAIKDENQDIKEDTIANQLNKAMGSKTTVHPFTILKTNGGALANSHSVKAIFHVATTIGVPGVGWLPVPGIEDSIGKCLKYIDNQDENFSSIVFPMFGTGKGKLNVEEIAPKLITEAISYLEIYPKSKIKTIYFSCWNNNDLNACQAALAFSNSVEMIN